MAESTSQKASAAESEVTLSGDVVSRGRAMGRVVRFFGRARQFFRSTLTDDAAVEREDQRLISAASIASAELKKLIDHRQSQPSAGIFESHLLILEHSSLIASAQDIVHEERVNAAWALKLASDRYLDRFAQIDDAHIAEKAMDLRDVVERVQHAMAGSTRPSIPEGAILVAAELQPSTLIELAESPPAAVVTEHGGWTSHAFIVARELAIPAVAGVKNARRILRDGADVIVDADRGTVTLNPSQALRDTLTNNPKLQLSRAVSESAQAASPSVGSAIVVAANAESPAACRRAVEQGADGIGLLRSEFLFDLTGEMPDREMQRKAYRASIEAAGGHLCRVRTFDPPSDRIGLVYGEVEKNPALGLRGIRQSLAHEDSFVTQLSAIVEASVDANVEIVLPMISSVNEITRARALLNHHSGADSPRLPRLGAMIEVPAAVLTIEKILGEADFICIGTNDLVQYLVAADRDNEAVASVYQTLHPAVLISLQMISAAARRSGKDAVVCGEIAGSAFYTPLLIGLGFSSLSMNVKSLNRVRQIAESTDTNAAEKLAARMLDADTADAASELLLDFHRYNFPEIAAMHLLHRQ